MNKSSPQSQPSGDDDPKGLMPPELATIDGMLSYLHSQHGFGMGPEDPLTLLFTMNRVFLADYKRMLDRHHTALTTIIGEALNGLTDEVLDKSLQDQVRLADRIGDEFKAQYKRARLLGLVNVIAAIICLPVLVYLIVK
jgi:hypothetical protein